MSVRDRDRENCTFVYTNTNIHKYTYIYICTPLSVLQGTTGISLSLHSLFFLPSVKSSFADFTFF